jgi:hypothetical protein
MYELFSNSIWYFEYFIIKHLTGTYHNITHVSYYTTKTFTISYCKYFVNLWDTTEGEWKYMFCNLPYLKILCWRPDDGRIRPKHVAVFDGIINDLFFNVPQTLHSIKWFLGLLQHDSFTYFTFRKMTLLYSFVSTWNVFIIASICVCIVYRY